jgi:hypothetical protein
MRKSLAGFVLALVAGLALPATSGATHQPNGGGPRDFTVGGGWFSLPTGGSVHIAFAAHIGGPGFEGLLPSGDDLLLFQDFAGAAEDVGQMTQVGEGATGHETATGDLDGTGPLPPFRQQGPVTCLTVVGNRASFFYEFEHAEPSELEGGGIQVYVEDNGPPVNGQTVDGITFDPPIPGPPAGMPPLAGPTVCPPPRLAGYVQGDSGNIIVHDAAP